VRDCLVLWDIDFTLVNAGGQSRELYREVFRELFGRRLETVAPMAGRTDRAIILDTLERAGVPDPAGQVGAFVAGLAAHAAEFAARVRAHGHPLPGAPEALRALAALNVGRTAEPELRFRPRSEPGPAARPWPERGPGPAAWPGPERGPGPAAWPGPEPGLVPRPGQAHVLQSVLTGNIRLLAEAKLSALGLTEYLDLRIGAYGDAHTERGELVRIARESAARVHGLSFPGKQTVVVGDTVLDVAAALEKGARAVAVATGPASARDLAAVGANAVLPDLTDTAAVVAAILG
jgi:phosphoglycolate phosphatase-like HAD superfamily hydrolase